jgi:hypothetical protein
VLALFPVVCLGTCVARCLPIGSLQQALFTHWSLVQRAGHSDLLALIKAKGRVDVRKILGWVDADAEFRVYLFSGLLRGDRIDGPVLTNLLAVIEVWFEWGCRRLDGKELQLKPTCGTQVLCTFELMIDECWYHIGAVCREN